MDEKTQRMNDLLQKMDQKNEIYKEQEDKEEGQEVIQERRERFKKLVFHENYLNATAHPIGGMGETVNSIVDNSDGTQYNKYGFERDITKPAVTAGITSKEALNISIERTIKSGAPINNIGFYDEVNWNLEKMGFMSKLPLDIKNAINDMLQFGNVKGV